MVGEAVTVAKKGQSSPRNDVTVKLDAEVVRLARTVASFRDIPLAEYLSERVRPLVEQDVDAISARKNRKS